VTLDILVRLGFGNVLRADKNVRAPITCIVRHPPLLTFRVWFLAGLLRQLDTRRHSANVAPVNLGSPLYGSSNAAWYYFTKAADWCLRLR
jgi:hypothetical protein